MFSSKDGVNKCTMVYDKGKLTGEPLPEELLYAYQKAGINDPFMYTYINQG